MLKLFCATIPILTGINMTKKSIKGTAPFNFILTGINMTRKSIKGTDPFNLLQIILRCIK